MGTINTRLARLEQQQGTDDQRRRQVEADAAAFRAKIKALSLAMRRGGTVIDPDVALAGVNAFMERFRAERAHLS